MGIEPMSSAWEAEVMAIIRRPQDACFPEILQSHDEQSHGLVVEEWWCYMSGRLHYLQKVT